MRLVIGTEDGLYSHSGEAAAAVSRMAEDVDVRQLEAVRSGVVAATEGGVYRLDSAAEQWARTGLEDETVVSIHETAQGVLYAGTRPAHLYSTSSGDGNEGGSWRRVESFDDIPGKEAWTQNYMGPAQVRDVRSHPRAPAKLFVAVETDGVYVSPDGGRTWEYRGRGLDNDPHGLWVLGQDSLVATCGRGLYRTDDAGRTWRRLDTHQRYFWYQYFREGIEHDGVYYTCAMDRSKARHLGVDDGVILRSTDGGETLDGEEFPGHDEDYLNAWAATDEAVYAGTVGGRLLRGPDDWVEVADVDSTIRSLAIYRGPQDGRLPG